MNQKENLQLGEIRWPRPKVGKDGIYKWVRRVSILVIRSCQENEDNLIMGFGSCLEGIED